MKCDKCIHKPICWMRQQGTVDGLEKLDFCCCYVEVNDPDEFITKGDKNSSATQPVIKAFKVEEITVVYTPNIQVRAMPNKSRTLCDKCYFYIWYDHCKKTHCIHCENRDASQCYCTGIVMGEPCRNFKRIESGADNGK